MATFLYLSRLSLYHSMWANLENNLWADKKSMHSSVFWLNTDFCYIHFITSSSLEFCFLNISSECPVNSFRWGAINSHVEVLQYSNYWRRTVITTCELCDLDHPGKTCQLMQQWSECHTINKCTLIGFKAKSTRWKLQLAPLLKARTCGLAVHMP